VRDMLSGHLCRCTGYTPIVAAVLDVAARRQAGEQAGETVETAHA
jgi:2-furoyl-CoA dehydrogenase 2Fe-2S iron sulfur subunit